IADLVSQDMLSGTAKVLTLVEAHIRRMSVSTTLKADSLPVLRTALSVLNALVDVACSQGLLRPALAAMELCQMIAQASHDLTNPFAQLPTSHHSKVTRACAKADIEDVVALAECEDDERDAVLSCLPVADRSTVQQWLETYPVAVMAAELWDGSLVSSEEDDEEMEEETHALTHGARAEIKVRLETASSGPASTPSLPLSLLQQWWVVLSDGKRGVLAVRKAVPRQKVSPSGDVSFEVALRMAFDVPQGLSTDELTLSAVCNSYIDCDVEVPIPVELVTPGDIEME
ncbi:hypothetical protein KIPB_009992, partial [Kipferlia bialata]